MREYRVVSDRREIKCDQADITACYGFSELEAARQFLSLHGMTIEIIPEMTEVDVDELGMISDYAARHAPVGSTVRKVASRIQEYYWREKAR